MAYPFYDLPSFSMLVAFEASARNASFKRAAVELNVTPGAISHQVKALETHLGRALFVRVHRGVRLNPEGTLLFEAVGRGFSEMSTVMRQLRRPEEDRSVTIAVTTAVSSLWLTPKLAGFWRDHAAIPINQHVADTPRISGSLVDLRIRYGVMDAANPAQFPLFDDRLVPVCSPDFARRHASDSLADLAQLPLIHQDLNDNGWTTWRTWFDALGFRGPIAPGMRVNNYTIALQAARDDAGLMLGWRRLVKPLLDEGALVPFGAFELVEDSIFFVEVTNPDGMTDDARTVLDWLLGAAG